MNKSAFIVEGHLEQYFIQATCPGRPVRRLECNGHNVSVAAIAKRIMTHCHLFNNNYYPIIVMIDREDRHETSTQICSLILSEVRGLGITDNIIIGIADRMIENWILADPDIINQCQNKIKDVPAASYEGFLGKNIISQYLRSYQETTDGVDLLLKCRASHIKNSSPSFADFCTRLPKNNCHWLKR